MRIDRGRTVASLLVTALVTLLGCSGETSKLAVVEGVVTLDGQPLSSGTVITIPEEGKGVRGEIDESGRFVLETKDMGAGAVPGVHRVAVTSYAPAGDTAGPEAPVKSRVPQKYTNPYNSGLTIDVEPEVVNEVTLELSSR